MGEEPKDVTFWDALDEMLFGIFDDENTPGGMKVMWLGFIICLGVLVLGAVISFVIAVISTIGQA